jgi:hypothetical protein
LIAIMIAVNMVKPRSDVKKMLWRNMHERAFTPEPCKSQI